MRNLLARADTRYMDELGLLQRSFNRMLAAIGLLIGTVQKEADEVAALPEQLAGATGSISASGSQFASSALSLTSQLDMQRQYAEEGAQHTLARAAKEVADTIAVVRQNIAAAVTAMGQGERDVRDVGGIADEANRALGTMLDGIRRITEVIGETASASRVQSSTMETLTATMTGVQWSPSNFRREPVLHPFLGPQPARQ